MKKSTVVTTGLVSLLVTGTLGLGSAQAANSVGVFVTTLTGTEEIPANIHGNADRGSAKLTLNGITGKVCVDFGALTLTGDEPIPTVGHIHDAAFGVSGPIVLHLFGGGQGTGAAPTKYPTNKICHVHGDDQSLAVIRDIVKNPADYYVNLHNPPVHGSGVVRGQIGPLKAGLKELKEAKAAESGGNGNPE